MIDLSDLFASPLYINYINYLYPLSFINQTKGHIFNNI